MSLEVEILLDKKQEVVYAEQELMGRVRIQAQKDITCGAVSISLCKALHTGTLVLVGEFHHQLAIRNITLSEGEELEEGQSMEWEFTLSLPSGPYTYNGKHLSVAWKLEAAVELSFAKDPKASLELVLEPGEDAKGDEILNEVQREDLGGRPVVDLFLQQWSTTPVFFFMVIPFIALGTIIIYYTLAGYQAYHLGHALLGSGLISLGLWLARPIWSGILIKRRMGSVDFDFSPILCPGDTVPITIAFRPNAPIKFEQVNVTLIAEESLLSAGNNARRKHSEIHKIKEIPCTQEHLELRPYRKDEQVEWKVQAQLPDDAPYSILGQDSLDWSLFLELQYKGIPKRTLKVPFYVIPNAARENALEQMDSSD